MTLRPNQPTEFHICETCKNLDYDKAFSLPLHSDWASREAGVLIATLGSRPLQLSTCEVCQLLWNSAFWPDAAEYGPPPDTTWELRAYSADDNSFSSHQPHSGSVVERGVCLTVIPEHRTVLANDQNLRNFLCEKGHIICTRSLHLDELGKRKPRLVPSIYDPQRVKNWLRMCRSMHGADCNQDVPLVGFRLIHCETLVVVDATDTLSWVALSYVWAIAQDSRGNPMRYGDDVPECRRLPNKIPGVVLDAITVAKSLGYGYIWIDRYCIDQSDIDHIDDQIPKMEQVYRGADLTIIAATQKNGLHGVGLTPRVPQRVVSFSDGLTLFVMPSVQREKLVSLWSFRGWTYQEEMLSRRRLYFTSHEMLFECNGPLSCWESIGEPSVVTITKKPMLRQPSSVFGGRLGWTLYTYYSFVSAFTRRYLTYESDTLNAFCGVMNTFIPGRSFDWVENSWKLPLHPFYGIASITSKTKNLSGQEQKVLSLGLSWHHHSTNARKVRRKVDFPSWSWAGWEGIISIRHNIKIFGEYSSVIELIQPPTPSLDSTHEGFHSHQPAIRILATLIPKKSLNFSKNIWQDVHLLKFIYLHREDEAEPLAETPQELMASLETGERMCVLLGGEKEEASSGPGGIIYMPYFKLYVLVLARVTTLSRNPNIKPVMQRVGMLMFRYDLKDEGSMIEVTDLSLGLDLAAFSRIDILIV